MRYKKSIKFYGRYDDNSFIIIDKKAEYDAEFD